MKKKKKSTPTKNWLNPEKTKILFYITLILITLGMLAISLSVEYGLITNKAGLTAVWVILGICAVLLFIDTLAQDKSTKNIRLAGLIFVIVYIFLRKL